MASLMKGVGLKDVVRTLESLAPLSLAEAWDNVGLLIEPSPPHLVQRLMLTNDLTQPVLTEAISRQCNMVLSYHPPIFRALKRLRQGDVKERLAIQCIENRVAVFSPHTSYDAADDGVNDWLLAAFGEAADKTCVLKNESLVLVDTSVVSESDLSRLMKNNRMESSSQLCYVSRKSAVDLQLTAAIRDVGGGRKASLAAPLTLSEAVERVKKYLGLAHLRVAVGEGKELGSTVKTVACCAGSGSTVLNDCDVDLYLSGEMSHHDVLHATSQGRSVILCEHSNSERGYLAHLQKRVGTLLPEVECVLSQADADPLVIM